MVPKLVLLLCLGLFCGCATAASPCEETSCLVPARPRPKPIGPRSTKAKAAHDNLSRRQEARDLAQTVAKRRQSRYRVFFDKLPTTESDIAVIIFTEPKGDQILVLAWEPESGWQLLPTALVPDVAESI